MTPRFEDVPEHWKHPEGPYRRAPEEYGGEWWLVNPFGSTAPWLTQSRAVDPEDLPAGFEEVFGRRPGAASFRETPEPSLYFRIALAEWEQNLAHFKRAGVPEWALDESVEATARVFSSWGMGRPRFYEGRYGWSARFVDSEIPSFEAPARAAIENTHLIVAQYQMAALERGVVPERKHPFTPPHVWPSEVEVAEED